jgi:hypothetical protein
MMRGILLSLVIFLCASAMAQEELTFDPQTDEAVIETAGFYGPANPGAYGYIYGYPYGLPRYPALPAPARPSGRSGLWVPAPYHRGRSHNEAPSPLPVIRHYTRRIPPTLGNWPKSPLGGHETMPVAYNSWNNATDGHAWFRGEWGIGHDTWTDWQSFTPPWYHQGILADFPQFEFDPILHAGMWQCTATDEQKEQFNGYGPDRNNAAFTAMKACGGTKFEEQGCFIATSYCQQLP